MTDRTLKPAKKRLEEWELASRFHVKIGSDYNG